MPNLLDSVDEDRRPHRRHEAQDAERRHPRQPGDGLHGDRVEGIRRLPAEEGNARAVRPGAGRHRPVLVRRLSEGLRHPLQGEQGLLRREAAGRRSRLRHHARRDRALRQAQGRRMPHQRLSAARRTSRRWRRTRRSRSSTRRDSTSPTGPSTLTKPPFDKKEVRQALVDGDRPRRDHQGRLSRRRREGQDPDPADDVVLRRQDSPTCPTTPRKPRRCSRPPASRRRSTSTSGTSRCRAPTTPTASASAR